MKQQRVTVPVSGRLPIRDRLVVASGADELVGTAVAHQSLGLDSSGLNLWRLDGPAALSTITRNIKPNGDMLGTGEVVAYNCQGGSLNLTLLPKETDLLEIDLDGAPRSPAADRRRAVLARHDLRPALATDGGLRLPDPRRPSSRLDA